MEPGFPKRRLITDRGYSVDYGGDYRYRYDLCPVARTVVVTDTADDVGDFTPLSIASTARVATINLTAGAIYHSIVYRSAGKQVWVFGTTQVIVIDANPNSVNFNTIINTITTTSYNVPNHAVNYSSVLDIFIYNTSIVLNPKNNTIYNQGPLSRFISGFGALHAYYYALDSFCVGNVNGSQVYAIADIIGNPLLIDPTSNTGRFTPFIFNDKLFSGNSSILIRNRIDKSLSYVVGEATIVLSASTTSCDMCYDPINQRAVLGGIYGGFNLLAASIVPFENIGSLNAGVSSILASGQANWCNIMYSPYSKKIYARGTGALNGTGANRYVIIDLSKSLANMVCGYREIDNGSHTFGAGYVNSISCFNGLKINDYYGN